MAVSKTRVNNAGKLLRELLFTETPAIPPFADFEAAIAAIQEFRSLHAGPLQRVAVNLRYYVQQNSMSRPIVVGQRLKRFPTIIDKLRREPGMNLSRMHDIGGCRAVVTTEDEVRAIAAHLQRRWAGGGPSAARIVREYDYIAKPKEESGYRAIHLVVEKESRLIEVQLRTRQQHAWAELIESVDRRTTGLGLKGGDAPADVTEYYRLGAELLAVTERGELLDQASLLRFRELHEKVRPTVTRNSRSNGS
jgi:putative GTP pyrophosphokinase